MRAENLTKTAGNQTTGEIDFDVVDYDTANMTDLTANSITIQRDGFYRVESMFHVTAGNANRQLNIFRNGVRIGFDIASGPSQGDSVHAHYEGDLEEGDIITASHFGTNQFIGGAIGPFLSVREIINAQGAAPTADSGEPLALAYATTTSDRDDPNTGDNISFDEVEVVSGDVTIIGPTITLPQSNIPYNLTWHGGFDFDGAPDDDIEMTFVGSTAPLLQTTAEADVFDTTAEGSDDNSGANVSFSTYQFFRTSAFALFDASAGDITVQLQVTIGATDIDITEGFLKVSQSPQASVSIVNDTAIAGLNIINLADGDTISNLNYVASNVTPITVSIDPVLPDGAKILVEDFSNTTLTNTVTLGAASDTFNGAAGPLIIDSGTGQYSIMKVSAGVYLYRGDI